MPADHTPARAYLAGRLVWPPDGIAAGLPVSVRWPPRSASDRALEFCSVPPARQPGLPAELPESRHVPHAGEMPGRNGLAEHRSRRRVSRDPASAVVQFDAGPADALVEGHAPAGGAFKNYDHRRSRSSSARPPHLDAGAGGSLPRGLRGLQGQAASASERGVPRRDAQGPRPRAAIRHHERAATRPGPSSPW